MTWSTPTARIATAWVAVLLAALPAAAAAAPAVGPTAIRTVLTPPGVDEGDGYGRAVAADGDTVVISAPSPQQAGFQNDPPRVYVHVRSGAGYAVQAVLAAPDIPKIAGFGLAVAVSGDTIVVGAPGDGTTVNGGSAGSAYVFTRSGGTWTQQAKLVAAGGQRLDFFGRSVDIDGDTVVVGTRRGNFSPTGQGAAFVFVRSGTAWTQQAQLAADDGGAFDRSGEEVTVEGDTIALGGEQNSRGGDVQVFTRVGAGWSQTARLNAPTPEIDGAFGRSVDLDGGVLAVGAPGLILSEVSGRVVVFTGAGSTWAVQAVVQPRESRPGDGFGVDLALSDGSLLIAGLNQDDFQAAPAFLFSQQGTSFRQVGTLPSPSGPIVRVNVAAADGTAVLGYDFDDTAGEDAGSATVYRR